MYFVSPTRRVTCRGSVVPHRTSLPPPGPSAYSFSHTNVHGPAGHEPVQSNTVSLPTTGVAGLTVNVAVGGSGRGGGAATWTVWRASATRPHESVTAR